MNSELFGNLFVESREKMADQVNSALEGLSATKVAELSGFFVNSLTPPGHMQKDVASTYMSKIVTLFGEEEVKVMLALAGWAAAHDVGSVQDFGSKPPIVCGTKEVKADDVFGKIIPVTSQGEPRQFCATMFEEHVDLIMRVFPQLKIMLSARSAEAGMAASDPKAVISFVRGVTPATAGGNVVRMRAKNTLLQRNAVSNSKAGAAQVAEVAATQAVTDAVASSGHNLF